LINKKAKSNKINGPNPFVSLLRVGRGVFPVAIGEIKQRGKQKESLLMGLNTMSITQQTSCRQIKLFSGRGENYCLAMQKEVFTHR
jgi:hypothetical protein